MYWQNTLCLCTLDSRLMKQLLNTKRNWVQPHTHTHTQAELHLTCVILIASDGMIKLSETFSFLLLFERLFVLVSGTHLLPLPCSSVHLPTPPQECHVSAMRQLCANELRWELLGSVVGTLLPSLASLYLGTEAASGRGRPLSERTANKQKKKELSPTGELHESLLVLLLSIHFQAPSPPSAPPPLFFIHGWRAALHFGRREKKDTEKQNSQSVGTFACSVFLSRSWAFISINSACTGICAPVVSD